jgi:hypothetical protein
MYDFSCQIAAGEIFPSSTFSFKMLDPTVLIHVSPVPECLKRSIECAIYSVTWIFNYVSHDDVVPGRLIPSLYLNGYGNLNARNAFIS